MTADSNNTMNHADLLIELGCEELPPKALDAIRKALFEAVMDGFDKNKIEFDRESSRSFSTPRRLALLLAGVASRQPDLDQERRGPALQAAFDDDGQPTGAALGFARSLGKEVGELETLIKAREPQQVRRTIAWLIKIGLVTTPGEDTVTAS